MMSDPSRRALIAASAAVSLIPASGSATEPPPAMTLVFAAKVTLSPPIEHGMIDGLRKRFIPITGGTVTGPKLTGTVMPGGGDWQSIHDDGITELDARYTIKADDGTIIGVTNVGIRVATPDIVARIAAGENVDPSLYYFRTTPRFEVAKGKHDWLRRKLFVAKGIRRPDHVVIEFFEVG